MSNYKEIFDSLDQNTQKSNSYTKEPNWMISIKAGTKHLTSSENGEKPDTAHALANYAYIFDHQFSLTRGFAMESSSKALMPDGGLTAHELKIIAPSSAISPDVHAHFSKNIMLNSINLIRIINVSNGKATTTQHHVTAEYIFSDVYISGLISKNDLICLGFRYSNITYNKQSFSTSTGAKKGTEGTAYHNLVTGASTATTGAKKAK